LLSWRKSTGSTIKQQFTIPALVAGIAAITGALTLEVTSWPPLTTLVLCAFVTASISQEFYRGTMHRMKNAKENAADAFLTLMTRARRRHGGYVIHFGVVLMFLGFAGEGFKLEEDKTLRVGESTVIGNYGVTLDKLRFEDDGQKNMVTADVTVRKAGTDEIIGQMEPAKWAYRKPEDQVTTEVAKMMSMREDLYLVLGGYDAENNIATLQLKVNPLVNFVWLGCTFTMFGFAIAVWPDRKKSKSVVKVKRMVPAFGTLLTFILAVVAAVMVFV
jgi:cytochrome c-type biogenesis protein CcmF